MLSHSGLICARSSLISASRPWSACCAELIRSLSALTTPRRGVVGLPAVDGMTECSCVSLTSASVVVLLSEGMRGLKSTFGLGAAGSSRRRDGGRGTAVGDTLVSESVPKIDDFCIQMVRLAIRPFASA